MARVSGPWDTSMARRKRDDYWRDQQQDAAAKLIELVQNNPDWDEDDIRNAALQIGGNSFATLGYLKQGGNIQTLAKGNQEKRDKAEKEKAEREKKDALAQFLNERSAVKDISNDYFSGLSDESVLSHLENDTIGNAYQEYLNTFGTTGADDVGLDPLSPEQFRDRLNNRANAAEQRIKDQKEKDADRKANIADRESRRRKNEADILDRARGDFLGGLNPSALNDDGLYSRYLDSLKKQGIPAPRSDNRFRSDVRTRLQNAQNHYNTKADAIKNELTQWADQTGAWMKPEAIKQQEAIIRKRHSIPDEYGSIVNDTFLQYGKQAYMAKQAQTRKNINNEVGQEAANMAIGVDLKKLSTPEGQAQFRAQLVERFKAWGEPYAQAAAAFNVDNLVRQTWDNKTKDWINTATSYAGTATGQDAFFARFPGINDAPKEVQESVRAIWEGAEGQRKNAANGKIGESISDAVKNPGIDDVWAAINDESDSRSSQELVEAFISSVHGGLPNTMNLPTEEEIKTRLQPMAKRSRVIELGKEIEAARTRLTTSIETIDDQTKLVASNLESMGEFSNNPTAQVTIAHMAKMTGGNVPVTELINLYRQSEDRVSKMYPEDAAALLLGAMPGATKGNPAARILAETVQARDWIKEPDVMVRDLRDAAVRSHMVFTDYARRIKSQPEEMLVLYSEEHKVKLQEQLSRMQAEARGMQEAVNDLGSYHNLDQRKEEQRVVDTYNRQINEDIAAAQQIIEEINEKVQESQKADEETGKKAVAEPKGKPIYHWLLPGD